MIKTLFLAAVTLIYLTAWASAGSCPAHMAEIDAALASAQISEPDMARVKMLRRQGEELHKSGNHDEAVKALEEAKAILGIG